MATVFPAYPVSTLAQAEDLVIFTGNQLSDIVNGNSLSEVETVDGFIAHEAQAVVPSAVTGVKDAVDANGDPVYQGIDQARLVPLLTAALQEAVGRLEELEARLA